ncbi:YolD-like family protein [Staphylococcus pseudintermedius]|nr:YolD-like family protein [Staphylococcus pseudintermedius]HDU0729705.1 YolD-like family protein [Staphylococcus pseudintermedius]
MKVINPNIPEPYCYEKDYRKIPREYLNPRIPQGRGIVKWQPFKTVPQQYEIINQYIDDQNKIDMPLLSQEQLEEINNKVTYKINNRIISEINYWEKGYIYSKCCYIEMVDKISGIMKVVEENGNISSNIPLNCIVSVD